MRLSACLIGREIFQTNDPPFPRHFPALSSGGQSDSLRLGARCRRQLSTTTGTIGSLWRNRCYFVLLGCKSAVEVFRSYDTIVRTTNDDNFTYLGYPLNENKNKQKENLALNTRNGEESRVVISAYDLITDKRNGR